MNYLEVAQALVRIPGQRDALPAGVSPRLLMPVQDKRHTKKFDAQRCEKIRFRVASDDE
jgi:hypothetical protein